MQANADLDAITDAVLGASRVLVAVASRSLAAVADEVTLPQYRALVVLQSRGPQPSHVLATELQIVPSSATRLADRLVAKGLIVRAPSDGNRREVRLQVTDSGAALVGAVSRRRRQELRTVVSAMDGADRQALVGAMDAFTRAAGEVPEADWYLGWA